MASDVTGRTLSGRYKIETLDHEELLGSVYSAVDLDQNLPVSVKVLHPDLVEDKEKFKRFAREITNTWMVTQENTVEVVDWGEDGDAHFLVLERLHARRLAQELELGPMPSARVAAIAAQIARAIGAAHQEGIVHRALTPENVLLLTNTDGDYIKVRDFGLSKLEKMEEETQLTTQNTRVGNAEYMAPEYIKTSKFHMKGDLYALGAVMYHMLTGRPPFTGTMMDVLSAHVDNDPVPPSSRVAGIPQWIDDIVIELLAKQPETRPGAYRVVQRLQTHLGDQLEPPLLLPVDANGEIIRPSGPPVIAIALGALLLAFTGIAVLGIAILATLAALVALGFTS